MKKYLNKKNMDTGVSPQKDFYRYAVGGWIKKNNMPADKSRWSTFDKLRVENEKKLRQLIVQVLTKKRPKEYEERVLRMYRAGNHTNRNARKCAVVEGILSEIDAITTEEGYAAMIANLHTLNVNVWWSSFVEPDEKKSDTMALYFYQGGLTLPDRDYYIARTHCAVRSAYKKHFVAMGMHYAQCKNASYIKRIMQIEKYLASASRSRTDLRDVHKQYNKRSRKNLSKNGNGVLWDTYLGTLGAEKVHTVIVGQPEYLRAIGKAMKIFTLKSRKEYLAWHVITSMSPYMSARVYQTHFSFFGKVLTGVQKMQPRWKRVLQTIDSTVGEDLGQMFVAKHFPVQSKDRVEVIAQDIRKAFDARIAHLTWMHPVTKRKARRKLKKMRIKIGHPKKWEQYRGLQIKDNDFIGNVLRARLWEHKKNMRKIGKKTDREEWEMTPQTVNAYYHPLHNEMVFPAGILQPPFFGREHDEAQNYGGFGTVIAHEITHGFDDQGSHFDENGNIKNWWRRVDRTNFEQLTQKIIKQFDACKVLPKVYVNGTLTLGENIADLGGIMIAYDAYAMTHKKKIHCKGPDGLTGQQRFFLAYALTEASTTRPQEQRRLILVDPHSPGRFRVICPLSHIDAFYEAFEMGEKSAHYRASQDRVVIW